MELKPFEGPEGQHIVMEDVHSLEQRRLSIPTIILPLN